MNNQASLLGGISDLMSLAISTSASTKINGKGAYIQEGEQVPQAVSLPLRYQTILLLGVPGRFLTQLLETQAKKPWMQTYQCQQSLTQLN